MESLLQIAPASNLGMDDATHTGWLGTEATPTKRAPLVVMLHVSVNNWAPDHDTCMAECGTRSLGNSRIQLTGGGRKSRAAGDKRPHLFCEGESVWTAGRGYLSSRTGFVGLTQRIAS